MGLVGAGSSGPAPHRRRPAAGFVDVVALPTRATRRRATRPMRSVFREATAASRRCRRPGVHVVHIATPNHLHYRVNAAAIARGKHVVSDKPLAMTAREARALLDAGDAAPASCTRSPSTIAAIRSSRRRAPPSRAATSARPHFLHGRYLQDWLLTDTDYSWRLEPDKGGASSALATSDRTGAIWPSTSAACASSQVLGDLTTVVKTRQKPPSGRARRSRQVAARVPRVTSRSRIWRPCCCGSTTAPAARFRSGRCARGTRTISARGLRGDRLGRLAAGAPERAVDRPPDAANAVLQKDPSLMDGEVRSYARLPGGHQEGWADAFRNVMRDIYGCHRRGPEGGREPAAGFRDVRRRLSRQLPRRCDARERRRGRRLDGGERA